MRDAARPTLSSEAPVLKQGHQPRPGAGEIRRQQERAVLADDAVDGVRRVGPVDEHADQRIVDRAELRDRLIGTGQIALDQIRRSTQFLERGHQLGGGLSRLGKGPLVWLGTIVTGPENRDFFRHEALGINESTGHGRRERPSLYLPG